MTVTTSCPTCMSLFRLPAELAGRQVRCQKCENTFIVPAFVPGGMETTAAVSAEASAPPIAKVVEPPPVQPPPLVQPPPVAAPPVLYSPTAETLEIIPVKAVPPAPPIEIVVVEEETAPPVPNTPAENPVPEIPKTPMLVPSPEPARWLGFGLLSSFMTMVLLTLCVSIWWVGRHLDARKTSPPTRAALLSAQAIPIEFDAAGQLNVLGQTRQPDFGRDEQRWRHDGPFELYSVHLEQGKTYNFCVNGALISPRLRIFDGRFNASADRFGLIPENKVILEYRANRTGEHLLHVSSSNRMVGDFILSAAEQRPAGTPVFDLADQPSVIVKGELSLEHPVHDANGNPSGVYREYRVALEQNRGYAFTLESDEFQPKVLIYDRNNRPLEFPRVWNWNQPNNKAHTFTYRPFLTGECRVRVMSERYGLGSFTLRISDTSNIKVVQTVIVTFQDGVFEDRRSFIKSDPVEPSKPGLGPYKEYVVTLEKDRRYRIEMKSDLFGTKLTVTNDRAQRVAGDIEIRNQPLIFSPAFTGQYQIRVIGENRKAIGAYQFRIEQLP